MNITVYNPISVPVVIDGHLIGGNDWASVEQTQNVDQALANGRLVHVTTLVDDTASYNQNAQAAIESTQQANEPPADTGSQKGAGKSKVRQKDSDASESTSNEDPKEA